MMCSGPTPQPTFQPVVEKVLPAEERVSVRSHMPGSVAKEMCGEEASSYTMCSYLRAQGKAG
jgi:hypothetical protein